MQITGHKSTYCMISFMFYNRQKNYGEKNMKSSCLGLWDWGKDRTRTELK